VHVSEQIITYTSARPSHRGHGSPGRESKSNGGSSDASSSASIVFSAQIADEEMLQAIMQQHHSWLDLSNKYIALVDLAVHSMLHLVVRDSACGTHALFLTLPVVCV
jgi:hypothetical protein